MRLAGPRAWQRWRALRPADRSFVLRGLPLLPLVYVLLQSWGLSRCLRRIAATPVVPRTGVLPHEDAAAMAGAFDAVARRVPWVSTCLTRSLVIAWLLRRRGADVRVGIGVKLAASDFSAHAWTEWGGVPLVDAPDAIRELAAMTRSG